MVSFSPKAPVERPNIQTMHSIAVLVDGQGVGTLYTYVYDPQDDTLWEMCGELLKLVGLSTCTVGPVWSSADRAKEDTVRLLQGGSLCD